MKEKSKGLGDTLAKLTKTTGIKSFVDKVNKITGTDCGCGKRQSKLNKLFPYQNYLPEDDLDSKK
jgi:hypothetical protein|tara:strand:+ start:520 stop:714 length:195 start_codon:yes stop_codon:yes gene_type:complete